MIEFMHSVPHFDLIFLSVVFIIPMFAWLSVKFVKDTREV